jgi:uncharacterized protein
VDFSDSFAVDADISTVWDFFENKPETVGMCIPGAQSVSQIGPDKFRLIVYQKVGHLHATFDLQALIEERVPVEAMRLSARGRSIKGARTDIRATAQVRLSRVEAATQVRIDSNVTLTGVAASLGRKVLGKRTAEVTAEFASELQRRLSAKDADPLQG